MKKTITALLCAAFVAAMLVPTIAASKPVNTDTKKSSMSKSTARVAPKAKRHHKLKHAQKAKAGDRSKSTLVRGVDTSAHKAAKFLKKTFSAPHKTPPASA